MRFKQILTTMILPIMVIFNSCISDSIIEEPEQETEQTFIEAPKCDGTVTAVAFNNSLTSRANSTLTDIDRFTATRVDTKNNDFVVVSYHGRNKEQIGMVQIINNKTKEVQSEMVFLDARVNFAQYRSHSKGDVVYIGVDRKGGDDILCGILCIPVTNGKFKTDENITMMLKPYKVSGVSINCIKQHNGDTNAIGNNVLVVASGGNDALGEYGEAGFTKFEINAENPTQLGILASETKSNYRGYWFSFGYKNKAPMAYTYRTVDNGDLVYKLGVISYNDGLDMFNNEVNNKFISDYVSAETEVYRKVGETEDFGRYCVIALQKDPGYKFVIVSTGNKESGIKVYRYTQSESTLTLVDEWSKTCVCLGTEVIVDGTMYIFAGLGDGVYKIAVDFDVTDKDAAIATLRPVEKRKTTTLTESGTLSSVNYIQVSGSGKNAKIHVAGGYEGYYVLDFNDEQFVPCDKR